MRDHFEFGKLYHNSTLNTGAVYNPKMEPFVVKWGDLVCEATEHLTRTKPGEGNLGFVPVYTTPEGSCAWDTLMDSIKNKLLLLDENRVVYSGHGPETTLKEEKASNPFLQ